MQILIRCSNTSKTELAHCRKANRNWKEWREWLEGRIKANKKIYAPLGPQILESLGSKTPAEWCITVHVTCLQGPAWAFSTKAWDSMGCLRKCPCPSLGLPQKLGAAAFRGSCSFHLHFLPMLSIFLSASSLISSFCFEFLISFFFSFTSHERSVAAGSLSTFFTIPGYS